MSANPANRKSVDRILTSLKRELESGDLDAFSTKLAVAATPAVLARFRERMLLLRAKDDQRPTVAQVLRTTASRCLSSPERDNFDRYIEFSLVIEAARRKLLDNARIILRPMPKLRTADLLAAAETVFEKFVGEITKGAYPTSSDPSVALYERRVHEVNGALNDVSFAVARSINEAAKSALHPRPLKLRKEHRQRVVSILERLTKIMAELNSLDWVFDSVSFGDFEIFEIRPGPKPVLTLVYADPRLSLLRTLSIRRHVILKHNRHFAPRFVRDQLEAIRRPLLKRALEHYEEEAGAPASETFDMAKLENLSQQSLIFVDAEDDLLFAASRSSMQVASYYSSAVALQWFTLAARAVRNSGVPSVRRRLASPAIPLPLILFSFNDSDGGASVRTALNDLTTALPARSHFELLRKPYVKDGPDVARPLMGGDFGLWNVVVRECLVQGGQLGRDVGSIWEEFYAGTFKDTHWRILGRGIKLKENGRLATDVDLLVARDDLLLVVQVKALIGSGATVYDHWRNRQIIETGCAQAKTAADFLRRNPLTLVSVACKQTAQALKVIQPVVLTNADTFDGWVFDDVPVMGETTLKGVTRGSKVDYIDPRSGTVVHTHHVVKPQDLNTESILWLLRHPIELQISPEQPEIGHRLVEAGEVRFHLPEFTMRDDRKAPPAHEPVPFRLPNNHAAP